MHYSEQVCSASRTALLTGRYSWKAGLNSVANLNTNSAYLDTLTLFPQLLRQNGWNNYIAGKWHIGYSDESLLPPWRGFNAGLYSHQGLQYYSRGFSRKTSKIDLFFGEPSKDIKKERKKYLGANYKVKIHDTWRINKEQDEEPAFVEDGLLDNPSYSEDIYTSDIKDYIGQRTGNKPFFIYYSQWTPHANLVQPPNIRPDGSEMDFSPCYDAFPNRTQDNCSLVNDTRCVFCKQVHYAEQNIEEIIQAIKDNDNDLWSNTVVIITRYGGNMNYSEMYTLH